MGYATHALHNLEGTFYDRHVVFANMGFDTFTPVEYMLDVERNSRGWAKDHVLADEILGTLRSTRGDDFIYAVSVQCHGKYPASRTEDTNFIKVAGIHNGTLARRYEYFVNQLWEVDRFIGDLTTALSELREPTILVMYGDHLPSLEIEDDQLKNGDVFQTEYVIWSNFGLQAENKDLVAYQLTAHVLDLLGVENGILTKLHQTRDSNEEYMTDLRMLEYDMLFGDLSVYGGESPYEPTELQMGFRDVLIENVRQLDGAVYVAGRNFTPFSEVRINGTLLETIFIDSGTLIALKGKVSDGTVLDIAQIGTDKVTLGISEEYRVRG